MSSTPDQHKRYTPTFRIANFTRVDVSVGTIALADVSIDDDLLRINRVRLIRPTNGPMFLGWPSWRTQVAGVVRYDRICDAGWPLSQEILDAFLAEYDRQTAEAGLA